MSQGNHYARCTRCDQPVDWVDAGQVAAILGVNESRVRQLVKAGRLPNAYKPSAKQVWRIPLTDVAALIAAREER